MKTNSVVFLGLIALFASIEAAHDDQELTTEETKCVHQLKLNKTTILKLKNQDKTPEEDSDFNDFLACYWKATKIQQPNGEINWAEMDEARLDEFELIFKQHPGIGTLLAGEILDDAVRKCHQKNVQTQNHGQAIVRLRNCIAAAMEKTFDSFGTIKSKSYMLFSQLFRF